jgi:hypothetical protein
MRSAAPYHPSRSRRLTPVLARWQRRLSDSPNSPRHSESARALGPFDIGLGLAARISGATPLFVQVSLENLACSIIAIASLPRASARPIVSSWRVQCTAVPPHSCGDQACCPLASHVSLLLDVQARQSLCPGVQARRATLRLLIECPCGDSSKQIAVQTHFTEGRNIPQQIRPRTAC